VGVRPMLTGDLFYFTNVTITVFFLVFPYQKS
jgi:hypothetical protein